MPILDSGEILREPTQYDRESSRMAEFMAYAGGGVQQYEKFWQWSVTNVGEYWTSVADYFNVGSIGKGAPPHSGGFDEPWFAKATINYAEYLLRPIEGGDNRHVTFLREDGVLERFSIGEIRGLVARGAKGLRDLGVTEGDCVVGFLSSRLETLVGMLCSAAVGAIWSCCPPEFGSQAAYSRISQLNPKVLIASGSYRYNGSDHDRSDVLIELARTLPTLSSTVIVDGITPEDVPGPLTWEEFLDSDVVEPEFAETGFNHPLYVLFSSGTTGLPKGITLGHGGALLSHLSWLGLHEDVGTDDLFFWPSSTGWMAWNMAVSALACGASVLFYDGSIQYPELDRYWRILEEAGVSTAAISPGYLQACRDAKISPRVTCKFRQLRTLISGGSPLPASLWRWVYSEVDADLYLTSASGGTDVGGSFVSGTRLFPVVSGYIACRMLGCDVDVVDSKGSSIRDRPGELILRQSLPSLPLYLWGDESGDRLRQTYFPGGSPYWVHGDLATIYTSGQVQVHGRSDATLNRGGVRIGTADYYELIEKHRDVADSLIVHSVREGESSGELLLFLVLRSGASKAAVLRDVDSDIRVKLSPRHRPDRTMVVPEIPYTRSGKKMEVPVKRLLAGDESVLIESASAARNPEALRHFLSYRTRGGRS